MRLMCVCAFAAAHPQNIKSVNFVLRLGFGSDQCARGDRRARAASRYAYVTGDARVEKCRGGSWYGHKYEEASALWARLVPF